MDRMQLIAWCYGSEESCQADARAFFDKLKHGVSAGHAFPFECPHEVYLLRNRVAQEWLVAVLVMRGTPGDDSIEQSEALLEWFDACDADKWHDRIGKPASWDWRVSYDCVDSFGIME